MCVSNSGQLSITFVPSMEVCVAEWLTPQFPDVEVWGSSLAHCIVSSHKELYLTLSLFTQVYKQVPVTYCWGVTLRWTSIPGGGVAILLDIFHAKETRMSSSCLGLWFVCTFTLLPSMKR